MDPQTTPLTLPIDADICRCLAHGEKVGDWCARRYQCARHETIKHDGPAVSAPTHYRVCSSDLMAGFLPLAGFGDA